MRLHPSWSGLVLKSASLQRLWVYCIVPLGLLAVVFASSVALYLINSNLSQQKDELKLTGSKAVASFDQEMMLRSYSVRAMRRTAEQYLMGRSQITIDPTKFLHKLNTQEGYTLDLPPGYKETEIGNISGAGTIPAKNSVTAREMAMTIGLIPLFRTVTARDSDTPWVYYTSKNRFTHIFPRASTKEFCYSDKSLEYDVYTMALPINNPQRKEFWTPPYLDEAGKGMMVSVAAPVYEGEHFRGTVALDITLSKLALLLKNFETDDFSVYLYTEKGDFLAGPANDLGFRPLKATPNIVTEQGDYFVTEMTLTSVPWRILVASPRYHMYSNSLWYALPFVLVVALLFGSVMLLIALIGTLRKAQEYSIRDSLTGMYNRRHFDAIADRELTGARRDKKYFGLLMVDIDHFKIYNDTYGHQVGDTVLKAVSHILTGTLKRPVDMAFRVGGEEFAILTKADRPEQIETLGQILHIAIEEGHLDYSASPQGHITVSIGVATLAPTTALSTDALYVQADQALYRAKEEGRNRINCIRL